jgi:hypothetical protein
MSLKKEKNEKRQAKKEERMSFNYMVKLYYRSLHVDKNITPHIFNYAVIS